MGTIAEISRRRTGWTTFGCLFAWTPKLYAAFNTKKRWSENSLKGVELPSRRPFNCGRRAELNYWSNRWTKEERGFAKTAVQLTEFYVIDAKTRVFPSVELLRSTLFTRKRTLWRTVQCSEVTTIRRRHEMVRRCYWECSIWKKNTDYVAFSLKFHLTTNFLPYGQLFFFYGLAP